MAGLIVWQRWQSTTAGCARAWRSLCVLLPLILILLGIAGWNVHRFGNPLNFGARQLYHEDGSPALVPMALRNIPYHLHRYLLGEAWTGRYFPFFQGEKPGPLLPAEHQTASDWLYGFLLTSPLVLWACLTPCQGAWLRKRGLARVAAMLALAGAGNLLFLCIIPGSSFRYPADFLGLFAFLAALGVFALDPLVTPGRRWLVLPLLGLTVSWSLLGATFALGSIAQIRLHFDEVQPAEISRLAAFFNGAVYRIEQITHTGARGVRLDLRFPLSKFGSVEPLVVAGRRSDQDFLYAYYTSPETIQFGFESMGHGGIVTGPIAMDYHSRHRLEIFYGSFLPPDDSPLVGSLLPSELASARRTVSVLLDSKVVLENEAILHPPRGQLFIGASPYDAAFGSKFTGEIFTEEHPLLKGSYFHPGWTAAMFGPATFALELQPQPEHAVVPIMSVGYRPTGGVLGLEYLGGDQVRWVWARFGLAPQPSPPFTWIYGASHQVEISSGSLLPPVTSALGPRVGQAEFSALKSSITCKIDGKRVFNLQGEIPETSPHEVYFGRNMAGIPGIADALPSPLVVSREAW